MSGIPDISHPKGMKPAKRFFEEIGEECINADGIIELARQIDTPQAKAIYQAFRKAHARLRLERVGQDPEKIRGQAVLDALKSVGVNLNLIDLDKGSR